MEQVFQEKLRRARLRCDLDRLVRQSGQVLLVLGALAILAAIVDRLTSLKLVTPLNAAILAGAAVLFVLGRWLRTRPTPMQVALQIDARLMLKERFSTTLALAGMADAFASAALREASARAATADVGRAFPIKLRRSWGYAAAAWGLAVGAFVLTPECDLFGYQAAARQEATQRRQLELARTEVKDATTRIEAVLKKLDIPDAAADLKALDTLGPGMQPADVRREAIKRLSGVNDRLAQIQKGEQAQATQALQQLMRGMKSLPGGMAQDLSKALQKGDFGQAAKLARALQDKLDKGDLTKEQKDELAKQLAELAKQLDKLAAQDKALEKALEEKGLDKALAKLDDAELRRKLAEMGMKPEAIDELLQEMKAAKSASSAAQAIARKLGTGSGEGEGSGAPSAEALAELSDQLDELEAVKARLAMAKAASESLQSKIDELGEDDCEGLGLFAEGVPLGRSRGSGGPGQGGGARETDESGATGFQKTKVKNGDSNGPTIATWSSKEEQVKGEAKLPAKDVVQAAKDNAAEAIGENRIPAKYQDAVKKYVDELEKGKQ